CEHSMPPHLFTLFAADPPPESAAGPLWTTNQVLYILAGIVVPILAVLVPVFLFLFRKLSDELNRARAERDAYKEKFDAAQDDEAAKSKPDLAGLKNDLAQAQKEVNNLRDTLAFTADTKETVEQKSKAAITQLEKTIEAAQGQLEEYAVQ